MMDAAGEGSNEHGDKGEKRGRPRLFIVLVSLARPCSSVGRALDSGALEADQQVAARFEPLRRPLFAPEWDGLRSMAAAAPKVR